MANYQEKDLSTRFVALQMAHSFQTNAPLNKEDLLAGGFSQHEIADLVRIGFLKEELK